MKKIPAASVFFMVLIIALAVSCNKAPPQVPQVEREDLFKLDIGRLEDQVALFKLEGDQGIRHTGMVMRDGFFYISDGIGGKILKFNSYGDLLFMIYNDETNPAPLTLKPLQDGSLVTKWAVSYPLQEPGVIAVDSKKHIYVCDRLPYERHSFDTENKAYLDSIILHFDSEGKFVEYLGTDGIGGSPFPQIESIYTSEDDDLAVICRMPTGWNIYWFNSGGTFLYLVELKNEAIPVPADRENVIPSVDSIAAAPDSRKLFIKVDYYRDTYDESTNTRTGNEPDSSVIWIMDIEKSAWEKSIEVPFYELNYTDKNRNNVIKVFYSMIGVIGNGKVFLSFPVDGGYSLLILSSDSAYGSEQLQRTIRVDNDELQFNVFSLSMEGILSGLLVDDYNVKLVWWRTDKLS
ncbi:MAG: hypothetical protein FWD78_04175 [Treponema sp.]|nr:hypothetical protein [Treponema sp.]